MASYCVPIGQAAGAAGLHSATRRAELKEEAGNASKVFSALEEVLIEDSLRTDLNAPPT